MSKISVVLSAANMGDVTEADFDAWASWVTGHIDEGVGFEVAEVGQMRFGDAGPDVVWGATCEQRAVIQDWLSHEGWAAFCADASAWPRGEEQASA